MRRTKIVATIGPASREPEVLVAMVEAGMDVARLNFSHGTLDEHAETLKRVRHAAGKARRDIAILQDLPGPKLRIGVLEGDLVELKPGEKMTLACGSDEVGDERRISVSSEELAASVRSGEVIYLADGAVRLRVTAVRADEKEIETVVEVGGAVASRQGLNIPGGLEGMPAVPEDDLALLQFGEQIGVDMVALSFVRRPAEDVSAVREHTRLPLVAKIEKPQAAGNAEAILRVSDCVMVARGDLGIELEIEEVPLVQKRVLALAGELARPSITATQMLDSMVASSRPTRAEVTDVANAILDGTDAVMLSQETAVGAHPVAAVAMMASIAERAETAAPYSGVERESREPRRARPGVHDRPLGGGGRTRPSARSSGRAHALRALGPPDLRPPAQRADLRALPRPRDRPPLRADVGCAGRPHEAPRGDRGADRRLRAPRGRAGLGPAGRARRHHGGLLERSSWDDEHVSGPESLSGFVIRTAHDQRRRPW